MNKSDFYLTTEPSEQPVLSSTRAPSRSTRDHADEEPNNNLGEAVQLQPLYNGTWTYLYGNFSPIDIVDWYKFNASKGDSFGNKAHLISLHVVDIATSSGVFLELYAPLPHPHKLARSAVHDRTNPSIESTFSIVAPLNGTYFIKILPNINPSVFNETYRLNINIVQLPTPPGNVMYDGDNSFTAQNARLVDVTSYYENTDPLSAVYDIHDFYYFNGYLNQTLSIELIPKENDADYDLFLFEAQTINIFRSSEIFGKGPIAGVEQIDVTLPGDKTYYVRVLAKINNTQMNDIDKNYGDYEITFDGNIPPRFKNDAETDYYLLEDGPSRYIEPEDVWEDLNPVDTIEYLLWNDTLGDWEPRDEFSKIVSTVEYDKCRIQIIENGTVTPDETIKITQFKDEFGDTEVKLGAKDSPYESIGEQNIMVHILPVNDHPIINNTLTWTDRLGTAVLESDKITVAESNSAEIQIDAYDIDYDDLTYSATFQDSNAPFAKEFSVDPATGIITFFADFTYIRSYKVNITVTDNGKDPTNLQSVRVITIEIVSSTFDYTPKTYLRQPQNGSILQSLFPKLFWDVTDFDTDPDDITYEVYLSTNLNKIKSQSKDVLIINGSNKTSYDFETEPLLDKKTYFWTVIPDDGIFVGTCANGWFKFQTDTDIEAPEVTLISPINNTILNYTDVELKWNIQYNGNLDVSSDVYMGISPDELDLHDTVETTNYLPPNLINNHKYYWQIVPKAGISPGSIEGDKSPIWSFEIRKDFKAPVAHLDRPRDTSIFRANNVTLYWTVEYRTQEVDFQLFLSNSPTFFSKPYASLSKNTSFEIFDLEEKTYYWKVVPYIGDVSGNESEIWSFTIDSKVVQPVVVPKYPSDNETINSTWVELEWTLDYIGSVADVRYDVYLDSNTDDPKKMELINYNYKQLFRNVEVEDQQTYYWRVVPTKKVDAGIIVGEFQGYVWKFNVDTNYKPPPKPKFNLTLEQNYIEIAAGKQEKVKITIHNTGNTQLEINISAKDEPQNLLLIDLVDKRIILNQGENKDVELIITAPKKIEPDVFIISVEGKVAGLRVEKEILNVQVVDNNNDHDGNDKESNNNLMFLILPLIIFLLIFAFLLIKRRKKAKEEKAEAKEDEETEEQVLIPEKTPYTKPTPEETGYKPEGEEGKPAVLAAKVSSDEGLLLVPEAARASEVESKPAAAAKPVATAKPVSGAMAAKPVLASSVKVEPIKAELLKTKEVKAELAKAQPAASKISPPASKSAITAATAAKALPSKATTSTSAKPAVAAAKPTNNAAPAAINAKAKSVEDDSSTPSAAPVAAKPAKATPEPSTTGESEKKSRKKK